MTNYFEKAVKKKLVEFKKIIYSNLKATVEILDKISSEKVELKRSSEHT